YVALVSNGLAAERDIGMVQALIRQAVSAIYMYVADDARESLLESFASRVLELARSATPDSDHQLAFTRGFTGIARTSEQLDVVEGLLDGSVQLEGLTIDTDLRWALLQRLVATDRADSERIERELDADNTASGQRQAALARAMLPLLADKEI